MKRRAFLLAGAVLAVPVLGQARTHRIGFLSAGAVVPPLFLASLRDLGYVEGKNLVVERGLANDKIERLDALAADLIRLRSDLIVALATPAAQAARKATASVPIVFVGVVDPVGAGLVASLGRPGGNVTGLSMLSIALSSKRLELLREIVPRLGEIGMLGNPDNASNALQIAQINDVAKKSGLRVHSLTARSKEELPKAFEAAVRARADALIVLDDVMLGSEGALLSALSAKHRLPTVCGFNEMAVAGNLIAYGVNFSEHFRRAAEYVDKILKGGKPAELPVEQPVRFELTVNLKTARALGLTIPQSVLLRADRVIE